MDTDLRHSDVAEAMRAKALEIGFSACGIASVSDVPEAVYGHWQRRIADGKHASMGYMEQHAALRRNPQGLLPDAVKERDGMLEMQYANIALLSAIALAKNVETHEERIARLERENKELRTKIDMMERGNA